MLSIQKNLHLQIIYKIAIMENYIDFKKLVFLFSIKKIFRLSV